MFHRILVPLDGSPRSLEALDAARFLAERTRAELVLLRVREPMAHVEDVIAINQELQHHVSALRENGIAARHIIDFGQPEASIAGAVVSQEADLIIMAPHRRSRLEAVLHPSVTTGMFSRAPVPLLIWPEKECGNMRPSMLDIPGSLVIVPLDGSELAEQALPYALRFAREFVRPLVLVRVVPPVAPVLGGPAAHQLEVQAEGQALREAQAYLAATRSRLHREEGIDAQSMVLRGVPEQELLQVVDTHDGGLMVISTHGRSGLARVLMGSVACHLTRNTPRPLLVVPPHTAPAARAPRSAVEHQTAR